MIVICEECGKKYRVDPEKIRSAEAKFKCKSCSHEIVITKPEERDEPSADLEIETSSSPQQNGTISSDSPPSGPAADKKGRTLKLGVRGKMILLFFLLPMMISGFAALYTLTQINRTAESIVEASTDNLRHIAEVVVANESRLLADRIGDYLNRRPGIRSADMAADESMKALLSRNVSWSGSAFLYALPDSSANAWKTVAHSNPSFVGASLDAMKQQMGEGYPGFSKIYTGVANAPISKGYFRTSRADGTPQETYMVARLIPDTPFVVAITVPVDQMLNASLQIKDAAEYQVYVASLVTGGMMLLAFLLIGITVTLYGHRLTSRIRYLTDVSDRISVGDLDTEVKLHSDDEIGELAESISRMQDSLRLSIERLRRRR